MRIGDISIEPVEPTRTGMYLVRAKDASFTGVGLLMPKKMIRLANGQMVRPEYFDCYGPLQFTAQADKIHTAYKIDPQWKDVGAPGRN